MDSRALGMVTFLYLAIIVAYLAGMWKVFPKAGQPGWAAIVPIYNIVVLLKVAGRPVWWLVLLLIPLVNFVVFIMVSLDMAKSFGKGPGFGIGLWLLFFVFYPILGFGDARYLGPAGGGAVPVGA
jgi:hypothetical protein